MDWPRGHVWALVAVLGLALSLRLVAAFVVQQRLRPGEICLIAGDATGYWELGRKLAAGDDYAIYDPPRYVLRMPGFPALLAVCQLVFGENLLATRLLLALVGTAACGLVYWLGCELFDPTTGLVAAALTAVWPTMILFSVLILSETLFAATMTASLIAVAKLLSELAQAGATGGLPASAGATSPGTGGQAASGTPFGTLAVVTGVLIALTTCVRPTWLLAGPFVAGVLLVVGRAHRRAWIAAALVLVGLAVTLAPWTLRNHRVTGHLVPTTLWVGPSLYDGLNPQADGSSHMEFVEREGVYQRMSEYDADQHYRAKAWAFARENPGRAAWLGVLKLSRYLSPWPNADQFRHPVANIGLFTLFAAMIGLAAFGLWRHRHDPRAWLIPLVPFVYFALIHTVFVGSLRYRLPAEYPLMILTAAGLLSLRRRPAPLHALSGRATPKP